MPRDFKIYLDDILESIEKINNYTSGMALEDFKYDPKTFDAVARNLEILGEAAKNIPPEIKSQYQDVEWKKITGLRDVLIHDYFGINAKIVWDVVQNRLPILKKKIEKIREELQ